MTPTARAGIYPPSMMDGYLDSLAPRVVIALQIAISILMLGCSSPADSGPEPSPTPLPRRVRAHRIERRESAHRGINQDEVRRLPPAARPRRTPQAGLAANDNADVRDRRTGHHGRFAQPAGDDQLVHGPGPCPAGSSRQDYRRGRQQARLEASRNTWSPGPEASPEPCPMSKCTAPARMAVRG